MIFPKM